MKMFSDELKAMKSEKKFKYTEIVERYREQREQMLIKRKGEIQEIRERKKHCTHHLNKKITLNDANSESSLDNYDSSDKEALSEGADIVDDFGSKFFKKNKQPHSKFSRIPMSQVN